MRGAKGNRLRFSFPKTLLSNFQRRMENDENEKQNKCLHHSPCRVGCVFSHCPYRAKFSVYFAEQNGENVGSTERAHLRRAHRVSASDRRSLLASPYLAERVKINFASASELLKREGWSAKRWDRANPKVFRFQRERQLVAILFGNCRA